MKRKLHVSWIAAGLLGVVLLAGSWRDAGFWSTAGRRGDALMAKHRYAEAAKVYTDPLHIGIARYRGGQFAEAVTAFGRVPGATGAYNAANGWLMQGHYGNAIAGYDKALGFKPGWRQALDNKQLAIARRDSMKISDKEREQESTEAYDPDKIVFDQKGQPASKEPQKPLNAPVSDADLQATWLRRVKTTPADFLKAKFAWQAGEAARQAGP